jgi:sortase (surface protein transpeptidase)
MVKAELIKVLKTTFHRYARVAVFAVVGMLVGAFLMNSFFEYKNALQEKNHQNQTEVTATTSPAFVRSAPVNLRIAKINLDVAFEAPLGLNEDQTVEVPKSYEKVGWYKNGATPGEVGPAVILGHVDSYKGPAIFYSLPKLEKGDEIQVEREDGTTAVFSVDKVVRYTREDFPTDAVYGKTDTPQLRLITCTGIFDKGQQKYSHNLVIYASLAEAKQKE